MKDYLDEIEMNDLTPTQQKIAESIGLEEFKSLVRNFGGIKVNIPTMHTYAKTIRSRIILDDFSVRRLSVGEIAKKHNLTYHYVQSIINATESESQKIKSRKKEINLRNKRIIREYFTKKITFEWLAGKYGLSIAAIEKIIHSSSKYKAQECYRTSRKELLYNDYLTGKYTYRELGKKYGITPDYVGTIIYRERKRKHERIDQSKL